MIVTEHAWVETTNSAAIARAKSSRKKDVEIPEPVLVPHVYRVWHSDRSCRRITVTETVGEYEPTDREAGLPCSTCVVLPARRRSTPEEILRRLIARYRPDVDFDEHKAKLVARGDWSDDRIRKAIARLDPPDDEHKLDAFLERERRQREAVARSA